MDPQFLSFAKSVSSKIPSPSMAVSAQRSKKSGSMALPPSTILFILLFLASLLLFSISPPLLCISPSSSSSSAPSFKTWSGDLRFADFSWNSLRFPANRPPPLILKVAVFSRKWPFSSSPGGMERHALTLHSALSRRGHQVHVFTSAINQTFAAAEGSPRLHLLRGSWRCDEAFSLFEAEQARAPFDVVHSESVALFHRFARRVPNLVVSWHGISLEALHSSIFQDLLRRRDDPISPSFNRSLAVAIYKVIDEIRFFDSYAHHVAISDSTGEILRDVYQITGGRVHVILNGVDEEDFRPDPELGTAFRAELGVPVDADLVMGVAGRLVKDKGHPLLFEAFMSITRRHRKVYLVVAGSGPWEQRYRELGENVIVAGALQPAKLRAFYNSIDVFLNPTLRPQGLDLTMMEAMQCGTPVMATRIPSIKRSVVVGEELGLMFAPNVAALEEAMEAAVLAGKGRMAEMGKASREYAAAKFTARKMAMAYERLFLCIKNETFCRYPLEFE